MYEQLVNGVALGSTYALVAVGYTLVFGVLNVVNLAHGQVLILSAFVSLEVAERFGSIGFVGALLVGALAGMAAGV
ncbi:ABC transporter permease subunit, partial [Nocardioides pyridinolyticus]